MLPRTKCPLLLDPVSPGIHRQIGRTFDSENLTPHSLPLTWNKRDYLDGEPPKVMPRAELNPATDRWVRCSR